MAWHEEPPRDDKEGKPSQNDQKEKDIWHKQRKNSDAPPDLEAMLRQLNKKLQALFGNKKRTVDSPIFSRGPGNPPPPPPKESESESDGKSNVLIGVFVGVALFIWGLSGIFIVAPAEQAVVLRFGQYTETLGPGPHWLPVFIDEAIVRDVDKVSDYSYASKMLTKDENIVSVAVAIQYRIGNLRDYLFNATDPEESLQQATASALRQVVGHSTLNEIIAEGREAWGRNVETLLNRILEHYQVGIVITSVSPQPARAPEEVQDAFDDAINAQEDEKRFKEQAYAYSASVVPIAEGQARRIITAATAFEQQVLLQAQGQTAAFAELLPEYLRSPALMRERMYLDMMESVLSRTSKVVVDEKSKNMLYLSLGSMAESAAMKPDALKIAAAESNQTVLPAVPPGTMMTDDRNDQREGRGN